MNRFVLLSALGLTAAATASAQPARTDSANVLAAIEQFHDALAASDSVLAVSLLADDAAIIESGAIQSRADYLSHHLGADMKASQGSKSVRTVMKLTIVGTMAYVVSKTETPRSGAEGSTGSELAELMVVSKTTSGWKIRAVHWSSRRRRA
ncbi:MAG: nuclear transport factor 2 family protein [Nitrospirota bacterium]|nr:nuclear transport factor 2 family protein [Nitrospirota bacterium]